jgi:hypothetical protein
MDASNSVDVNLDALGALGAAVSQRLGFSWPAQAFKDLMKVRPSVKNFEVHTPKV